MIFRSLLIVATPYSVLCSLIIIQSEYCLFYMALLQKRPMILRRLLIVATPYSVLFSLIIIQTEYCLFYMALLQKRPVILRRLLIVATPYSVLFSLIIIQSEYCLFYMALFAKETCDFKEPPNRSHPLFSLNNDQTEYGVATISRLLKIIGLFCKRAL